MLPNSSQPPQPDSVPFLLVRPVPVRPVAAMKSDVVDDEAETTEIPASKSVPPHSPPAAVNTTEHELPSVIVDLHELEVSEMVELQRASDVDGLLMASETIEFPEVPIAVEEAPAIDGRALTHRTSVKSGVRAAWARGFAIATMAAIAAAGGTFAGLKVCHGAGGALGAIPHVVR